MLERLAMSVASSCDVVNADIGSARTVRPAWLGRLFQRIIWQLLKGRRAGLHQAINPPDSRVQDFDLFLQAGDVEVATRANSACTRRTEAPHAR